VEIGHASVTVPETEHIGIQVFTALDKIDADGHREWLAVAANGGRQQGFCSRPCEKEFNPGRIPPKGTRGSNRRNDFDLK
jgi:hypothetical protein